MGNFSIWHWVVVFILVLPNLVFIPTVRKAGFSGWWVALSCVPLVGLGLLWVFAYAKWPAQPERSESDAGRAAALAKVGKDGFTPLMFYAAEGDLEMASQILATGVDVNSKNTAGMTALMFAAANGQLKFALWLIDCGAQIDEKSSKGKSANDYAVERGHLELGKLLSLEKSLTPSIKR